MKRIAIVMSVEGASQKAVLAGFKNYLEIKALSSLITFSLFNGMGYNEEILRQILFNIYHNNNEYDLVYVMGLLPIKAILSLSPVIQSLETPLPTLFCATGEAHKKLTWEGKYVYELPHVTGIELYKNPSFLPLQALPHIKKNMYKGLLPYVDEPFLHYEALKAKHFLEKKGICIELLKIKKMETYAATIINAITDHDSLLLPYNSWIAYEKEYKTLVKFCNRRALTLFTSSTATEDERIVFGFNHDFEKLGIACAEVIERILLHNENPSNIPVKYLNEVQTFTINKAELEKQGVILSPDILIHIEDDKLPMSHFCKTIGTLIPDYATLYSKYYYCPV